MKFMSILTSRLVSIVTGSLAALSLATPAISAEYDEATMPAQPAELTDKKSSLQNQVQFPLIDEDVSLTLLCNARISNRGRFSGTYCHTNDVSEERFEREVVEAARSARIDPATLSGRKVEVQMNFAVIFEKRSGIENIQVFLHHFRNAGQMGNNYIGAQRFLAHPNECPTLYVPVWMQADVMATGSAFNISVFESGDTSEVNTDTLNSCITSYTETMKENLYVPAIFQGQYVNSKYIELFYTPPVNRF